MRLERPPGPKDAIFGLSQLGEMQQDFPAYVSKLQRLYGDIVYLRLGHLHEYMVFHPDLVREVLVEKAASFIRYERQIEVFSKVHGQSVLVSEGQTWQRQRRMLLPAFSPKSFPSYVPQIVEAIDVALSNVSAESGSAVDFEHLINMATMDAIMRTMFGTTSAEENMQAEYAIRELSKIAYKEVFRPASLPDWLPLPNKNHKRRCIKILDDIIWRCIDERRRNGSGSKDLLDQLLEASDTEGTGGKLSDQEIHDQCMTIFLAGHDTTAAGLTWAGWCLANHPDIAARAREEVDAVLGDRLPTYTDLPHLPYTTQIVKETLRLYPPAIGTFLRRAIEDVEIGSWKVPRGSLVAVLSFVIQRDPRWYPNPTKFDPDRFSADRSKSIPRGAFIPFGTGPRGCIGNNFAMMEITLIVAMLVQRYVLQPAPGMNDEPGLNFTVTLRPAGGMRLVLEKRLMTTTKVRPNSTAHCPFHAALVQAD